MFPHGDICWITVNISLMKTSDSTDFPVDLSDFVKTQPGLTERTSKRLYKYQ